MPGSLGGRSISVGMQWDKKFCNSTTFDLVISKLK